MIRVLIVEDDPMVAHINKKYIESVEGYEVISVTYKIKEIRRIIEEENCDLITLDIGLPNINGVELLKKIREINTSIDIIMVTASQETLNIEEAFKWGAIDYLIKPFEFDRLKESLESYKKRKALMKQKTLNQDIIDNTFLSQSNKSTNNLDKGIHPITLRIVKGFFENNYGSFSAEEISKETKLSKATVRRYLEYLVKQQEVEIIVEYKAQGRPGYLYKIIT